MGQKAIPILNGETFHGPHANRHSERSRTNTVVIPVQDLVLNLICITITLVWLSHMDSVTKQLQPCLPYMNQGHSGDRKSTCICTGQTEARLCWMVCLYKYGGGWRSIFKSCHWWQRAQIVQEWPYPHEFFCSYSMRTGWPTQSGQVASCNLIQMNSVTVLLTMVLDLGDKEH